MTQIISALLEVSARYDALFVDLWGCLHNGQQVYSDAVKALQTYRKSGGKVVLLTNAARPNADVARQLTGLGAPDDCYDFIVTSGDAAKDAMVSGLFGQKVYFIGPDRDLTFFQGTNIKRVPLDQAEGVVCTGLVDDRTETPDNYRAILLQAKTRALKFLCANPDIVVDVGERRIFCAGALAEAYTNIGGQSFYFGKPHAPIYHLARNRLSDLGPDANILCIGDGILTDIAGGIGEDLDTLFITGGIAALETGTIGLDPDQSMLDAFLTQHQLSATNAMGKLR